MCSVTVNTMKAIRIHAHGGAEVLRFESAEKPLPGLGELLIRVVTAGVNPADQKHRDGMFKDFVRYVFPKILGYDVAGTVEALGEGVTAPVPGTRVFAMLDTMVAGGYAQYVTTAATSCAVMPDAMDFATAAGMACPALTGTQMVEEQLKPKPGELVLVTGATGMVGRFAVRAAKVAGARVVAAVREVYFAEALAMGADEVVALDGRDWTDLRFDGVIDTVGGAAATALVAGSRPGARILTAATDPLDAGRLPSMPEFIAVHPDGARLERLGGDVMDGFVTVPVKARFPLAEAAKAQAMIEAGQVGGKVVLIVDPLVA
jgi:NADPH2:quinone reductase